MLNLTYRQAKHLGVVAQPDAFYSGSVSKLTDSKDREDWIRQAMIKQGMVAAIEEEEEGFFFSSEDTFSEETINQTTQTHCIYRQGEDLRQQNRALLRALRRQIGTSASDMPDVETTYGIISRIAKIYAADLPRMDFSSGTTSLDFNRNHVGYLLEQEEGTGEWALKKTAKVIARSLVLPCLLVLDAEEDSVKADIFGDNQPPSPLACFALKWRLDKLK